MLATDTFTDTLLENGCVTASSLNFQSFSDSVVDLINLVKCVTTRQQQQPAQKHLLPTLQCSSVSRQSEDAQDSAGDGFHGNLPWTELPICHGCLPTDATVSVVICLFLDLSIFTENNRGGAEGLTGLGSQECVYSTHTHTHRVVCTTLLTLLTSLYNSLLQSPTTPIQVIHKS